MSLWLYYIKLLYGISTINHKLTRYMARSIEPPKEFILKYSVRIGNVKVPVHKVII